MEKISGIYKITSPSGRIYIGRSVDIYKRFNEYKKLDSKTIGQTRLYRSLLKYGVEYHTFEVLEGCSITLLSNRERYWQDFYEVIGEKGLNCILEKSDNLPKILSEDTKIKLSKAIKESFTEDRRKKISEKTKGENNPMFGRVGKDCPSFSRIKTEEEKLKISISNKGKFLGDKSPLYKIPRTKEVKDKISAKNKGKIHWANIKKANEVCSKIVLDTNTGIFYNSAKEAAKILDMNYNNLKCFLSNRCYNKTSLIYC